MGKLLMIQEEDNKRIEHLRKKLRIKTKVQVVRNALDLLEKGAQKIDRIERWKRAARIASRSSKEVLSEFMPRSRIHKDD